MRAPGSTQTALRNVSLPLLGLATFVLLWELLVWVWSPPEYLLPSFITVATRIEMVTREN